MSNKETLQNHNSRLNVNNVDLSSILDVINNLPENEEIKLQEKSITPTITQQEVVADVEYTGLSKVIVQGDTNLIPENIKEGVSIFGVNGNMTGGSGGTGGTDEWEEIFASSIDGSLGANVTKLPSGITSIGTNAFRENSKLALKELPETIRTIGTYAFYNCTNLALKKLPSELKSLGNYSFCGCTKLSFSEIPVNVTTFPSFCFNKCSGLTSITILGNITEFAGQVFYQASNLERVVLPNITGVPVMGSNVFSNTKIAQKQGYIYVPDNLVEEIKVAPKWSDYADQIKPISELTE